MAMMDPNGWNGQDQSLSSANEDDFQQFLEMGGMSNLGDGMQFDFDSFNGPSGAPMMHQPHDDSIDTPMTNSTVSTIIARSDMGQQSQLSPMTSAPNHAGISAQMMAPHPTSSDPISEIDAQIQYLQQQRIHQQRRQFAEQQRQYHEQQAAFFAQQQQRNIVPPTPQSLEMQAANRFYSQPDQTNSSGMFDGYQHLKEQQEMAFTPLVSPAVTPLEPHFPVDAGFSHPGPYFSPLTSPALHAQNEPAGAFDHRHSGHTTNSPVEMDIEPSPAVNNGGNLSKKPRKSNASKTRKPNVRQSPITKPQRRKPASTPVINAQVLSELAESAAENSEDPPKPKSSSAASTEESENASVSPEALSDMPPPPLPPPRSARQSPYIQAQTNGSAPPLALPGSLAGKPSPATPASLFRISPKSKSADPNHPEQSGSEHIESFELPESVNFSKQNNPTVDVQKPPQPAPEAEPVKTSTFQPLPSPVLPKPTPSTSVSANPSPQLTPRSTPNPRKTPLIAPRGPKKRGSISSISPALRPKISPNIKPLLPGTPGMSAEDSASRLLASKSNYQNILEGNTVPGVSYPSELSTNLTSKRTSHKIAEQGRRNRINSALQEIATLLPKSVAKELSEGDGEGGNGDKKDGKPSNTPNSKASTVELAIVYIKQLQQEIAEANRRADEAEKKLEAKATAG